FAASLARPFERNRALAEPWTRGALAEQTPEEHRDPAPEVHRVLMTLRRSEHLAFELARVGTQRLTDAAFAVGLDLSAGRGLEVLPKLLDLRRGQRQAHRSLGDLGHLLRRHVARLPESGRRNREAVEDVSVAVAHNLVHLSDLAAVGRKHLPAGLDQQPGNRVSHRRMSLRMAGSFAGGRARSWTTGPPSPSSSRERGRFLVNARAWLRHSQPPPRVEPSDDSRTRG